MQVEVTEECSRLADEGKMTFPESVARLIKAGFESYYADLLSLKKIYFSKNNTYIHDFKLTTKKEVAAHFDRSSVVQAIREIQADKIQYQEFLRKIMDAGVIFYVVFMTGKKVIYFGRHGEQHIEEFPR